ncbi:MAG TPA: protein-glutamate O-methyltransferase CheR [Stellaceae bacterium]|nr:protein-glutamate O-methyltransferase CheR [Stellaceae bacterium]
MTETVRLEDIERFRVALGRHLGLQFDDSRRGFLGEALRRRLRQLGAPADTYLSGLDTMAPGQDECAALARELTVGETYFFRNSEQFRALADIALPDRMRANAAKRTLHLLSAGCASGEESYSLAIILRQAAATAGWDIALRAVDINPAALEKAARARYSSWALRETPAETQSRWFQACGRDLLLDPTIRCAVDFDERNLAVDDGELWRPCSLDIVFCRNVMMYFAPEQARALMVRITRALHPGGYLFLGHAETLRGLSDDFYLRHTHGTFYYQRKEETGQPALSSAPRAAAVAASGAAATADAWADVIRDASERVAVLAHAPAKSPQGALRPTPPDLVEVLDLLRRERFAEALALLRTLSPHGSQDPDALLLEATLLANSRLLPAAEQACARLLAVDELNAGAHYVLALCREGAGDLAGAVEHDRVATYLDPGFAMPRLHLGLLARRDGDRAAGQRELAHALVLLKREDASRVLLFGGGFTRDALLALCGSALRDCGGAP